MEYILLGLVFCVTIITVSKCIYLYVDEFYELDFDIFIVKDE